MPLTLALSFPAGRFHATPWGHHVNEGLPEWPPSPWRLLRALVATWKRKLAGESLVQSNLPIVLAELARLKPEFALPPATLGHTRHFMPLKFPDQGNRTKVFDAFVSLSPDSDVVVHWPDATLSEDGLQTLELVLSQLGYLGRAESWSTARVLSEFNPTRVNCRPGPAQAGQESVRVLTTDPERWNAWDFNDKKIAKPDPLWNLLAETADMHQEKWSDPPGSKWVSYARASDCFAPIPAARRQMQTHSFGFTTARYALDGAILPLVENTLPLAERARRHLMGRYKRVRQQREYGREIPPDAEEFVSATLAGKDADGRPLAGHRHAFYLPTDEDNDGRLDHLTIVAEAGFDADEVRALDWLRSLRWGEAEPLRLMLVGLGAARELRVPFLEESAVWVSATPFLATRYPKPRGRKRDPRELLHPSARLAFAARVLGEELARLRQRRPDLPDVVGIEPLAEQALGARRVRPWAFQRGRRKPGDDGGRRSHGAFRITFAQPTPGSLCLGHACHFGLGLFFPES